MGSWEEEQEAFARMVAEENDRDLQAKREVQATVERLEREGNPFRKGKDRKYPWSKWFVDGQINKVSHEKDFESPPEIFRTTVSNTAKRRGWAYVSTSVEGPDVVFFVTNSREVWRQIKYGIEPEEVA